MFHIIEGSTTVEKLIYEDRLFFHNCVIRKSYADASKIIWMSYYIYDLVYYYADYMLLTFPAYFPLP